MFAAPEGHMGRTKVLSGLAWDGEAVYPRASVVQLVTNVLFVPSFNGSTTFGNATMRSRDPFHGRRVEQQQVVPPVVRDLSAAIRDRARRRIEMRAYLARLHGFLGDPVIPHEDRRAQIYGRVIEVGERRTPRTLEIVLRDLNCAVQGDSETRRGHGSRGVVGRRSVVVGSSELILKSLRVAHCVDV